MSKRPKLPNLAKKTMKQPESEVSMMFQQNALQSYLDSNVGRQVVGTPKGGKIQKKKPRA